MKLADKYNRASTLSTVIILIFFGFVGSVKAHTGTKWTRIADPSGDVSFSLPEGFLVDKDDKSTHLYFFDADLIIDINVETLPRPNEKLDFLRKLPRANEIFSEFKSGGIVGIAYTLEGQRFVKTLFIASKNSFYEISAAADSSENVNLVAFLNSIRLAGRSVFKQENAADTVAQELQFSQLSTSLEVVQALRRKGSDVKVEYAKEESKSDTANSERKISYSRPTIILRKPSPQRTAAALNRGERGVVRVRVSFQADGSISKIVAVSRLDYEINHEVARAAKNIKFLPAQVDGKPVEGIFTVEYKF
jgi:TonB family protein